MEPVLRPERLAARTAEALLARIRSGTWELGHRLPGETTLAAQLGVGRSTVREAVRELAGRGVLESRQGAGVFVRSLDVADDWDTVLLRASVAAVIEARIAIEAEAAALAARRRTAPALRAIRTALKKRLADQGDVEAYVDADMELHRAVVAAAGNPVLSELFASFVPRIRAAMVAMIKATPLGSVQADHAAHVELVEAIAAGDPGAAAAASRHHLNELLEALS